MARRTIPAPQSKMHLSVQEMRAGIDRLTVRLRELEAFDVNLMAESHPPALTALSTSVTRALERTFGEDTSDFRRFSSAGELSWSPGFFIAGERTPLFEYQAGVERNLNQGKALIKEAIRTLEEDISEVRSIGPIETKSITAVESSISKRVFIVHGHDGEAKESVARFLEKIGLEAVILHERPNKGRTIITKFREESEGVGFAIVLMTPDDHGAKVPLATKPRARQNVVFELGFFIGALGPANVVALTKGELEKPSDFDGVLYISMDSNEWKMALGKELDSAGFAIDWNKVMRS